MKRYKRILVLLGVLAACCAATFALTRYEEHKEEIAVSGQTVLAVDPDTVTAVSWTVDGESLGFHKDGTWQYDGDAAFPVDAEKIGKSWMFLPISPPPSPLKMSRTTPSTASTTRRAPSR